MRTFLWLCVTLLSLLLLASCSGSSSGSSQSPLPPSFSISLSPTNVTLMQGGSQNVQVLVNAQNGFSGSVSVTTGSLPAGVTVSPSSLSLSPGIPGTFALSASTTAGIEQASTVIEGASGSLTASASLQLTVNGVPVPDPFHLIGGEFSHGFYDQSRQLLFVANNALNEVDVLSGTNLSVQSRVPAPQPWGMDQMADGNTLVIGTTAQQIVTLDEDTLAVTSYPVPQLTTITGLFYTNVVALANGKVFIIGEEVGVDSDDLVDGGQYLIEWDSTNDTFNQLYPTAGQLGWETDHLARSADHKWAIFSADQFYLYSSDADTFTTVPLDTVDPPQNEFGVRGYAMNADGSKIGVVSAQQATFLDRSFNVLGIAAIPGAFQDARTNVTFTPDGTNLLLQYDFSLAIEVLDANNYAALGFYSGASSAEDNDERLLAVDSTGRALAGYGGGVREIDMTGPILPNPTNGGNPGVNNDASCALPSITEIPLNAAQQVSLSVGSPYNGVSYYFNGQPAPVLSNGTQIEIPASSTAGGIDIECIGPDGDTDLFAGVFSYGVELLGVSASLLPPTGNASGYITGFGFSSAPGISIGGQSVTVQTVSSPENPLQVAQVQVPKGTPGASVNVAVSSPNGSGSLAQAMTYVPSASIVSASGLLQVLYDPTRSLLYALKATEVDVLNPTTLQWQSPIPIPGSGPSVTYNMMAISPDGSWLAVASPSGYMAVINLNNPSQGSSVATNSTPGASIAISEYDKAILPGIPNVEVDLPTLAVTPIQQIMGGLVRASADGSHLYAVDVNGTRAYSIDPVTYSVQNSLPFAWEVGWSDLAVSSDGSQFAAILGAPFAAGDLVGSYSPSLNLLNFNVYPLVSPPDDTQVLGAAFSPAGTAVVVPLGDSIEFWDAASGILRGRLMTPEELNVFAYPEVSAAPQMALDTAGQTIFAVSASGLTVVQLPQPIDSMRGASWTRSYRPASRGYGDSDSVAARVAAMHKKHLKTSFLARPAMKILH